jgi:hypothetical protein
MAMHHIPAVYHRIMPQCFQHCCNDSARHEVRFLVYMLVQDSTCWVLHAAYV